MIDLSKLYNKGTDVRSSFLERAYRSATLTIPALLPRQGMGRDQLPQNYSSVGARGVNSLSSKLSLSLFPTATPFFRLQLSPFAKKALASQAGGEDSVAEVQAQIEKNLSLIEETTRISFETGGWRSVMSEAMKHLLVTGNACVFVSDDGVQMLDLRKFVVERDPEGNLVHVIIHQMIDRQRAAELVPKGTQLSDAKDSDEIQGSNTPKSVSMYTGAIRQPNGSFKFLQQIADTTVYERVYSEKKLPLIPLRFNAISGESYGSGYIEEYDGDLLSLEALSRSITESALVAAKTLLLVRPGAAITPRTVATAPNGAVRQGNSEDVSAFRLDKHADMSVAERRAVTIESRLQLAFLMAHQRQAERVTAEEVRSVIQELEDGLGGVYSSLAAAVQRPIVDFLLSKVLSRKDVPTLPKEVDPIIITGLDAISRGQTANKLLQAGAIAQQVLGPETALRALDERAALLSIFTSVGLDADSLLKSADEIAAEQQQAQMMALAERATPNAVNAMSQAAQPSQ